MKKKPTKKLIKRKVKRKHALPPHTWESHPVTKAGEINKTLIISLIVVVLLVGIVAVLFLVDTGTFAGQAIKFQDTVSDRNAGIFLDESTAIQNANVSLPIKANIGSNVKSVAMFFSMKIEGIKCDQVTFKDTLNWNVGFVENNVTCIDDSNLMVSLGTINPDDAKSGTIDIGNISFKMPAKTVKFTFTDFTVYQMGKDTNIITTNNDATITLAERAKEGCFGPTEKTLKDGTKESINIVVTNASEFDGVSITTLTDVCTDSHGAIKNDDYVKQYFCNADNSSNSTVKKCANYCISGKCIAKPGDKKPSVGDIIAECGNARKEGSEQCDDGNKDVNDGCASCQIIKGYTCTEDSNGKSTCSTSSGKGITIEVSGSDKKVLTTQAVKDDTVTVKVSVTPTNDLPSHLLIATVNYGSKQKMMVFDNKPSLDKGETETMQFTHKAQSGKIKIEAVAWNQWPSAKGKFKRLISKEKVVYDVK